MSAKWYETQGPEGDVVLSTRIRLARNLSDIPFGVNLDAAGRRQAVNRCSKAFAQVLPEAKITEMEAYSATDAHSLAEKRLISPEFADREPGTALVLMPDETVSVMLCEEDHIRLQVMQPGLDLENTWKIADMIDTAVAAKLPYAFDEQLGYLTQCPTNVGLAMRASVMLHLPALSQNGAVKRLTENIGKLGMTLRGAFGEGSAAQASMVQLSNQMTLGLSESDALQNLQTVTLQLVEQERRAQAEECRNSLFTDQIWRAYGILKYARRLETAEAAKLLSLVRMGACRGVLPVKTETVTALLTRIQPAVLELAEHTHDARERDEKRAELIRTTI
ncbi:MAG: ATP--guanido phosphotransferase [Oscillospiraceae bacterium]|jgi:protein arginine kinase|nr:ATP--guanido phosphotransferase [Oscillospiraceae bacterium]